MDHLTRLLLAAQRGDVTALDRFVAETQAEVWNLCRYLGDARDADDLAQEVYERAIKSLPRYRAEGAARGWLLTIARRVCADHVRRAQRRRRKEQAAIDDAHVQNGFTSDSTLGVDLDELLSNLDDDRRTAFVLTQVLGMYYDEAAEVIGCPVGTVRSRVSRARVELAAMAGASVDDGDDLRATGTN
ncbi:sigma-70 family RNA polymerase sigma factor [Ilumatobacter sp.]|uniref:sigma-70 family RNA polymerase sigma factor n=1 Tax=Ilumatobacter sp. TaxID=1967498 RepID=UPI003C49C584